MIGSTRWLAGGLLATLALPALAAHFYADAKVVEVVPVTRSVAEERPSTCADTRPSREAGLGAMLQWDLCPPELVMTEAHDGYRVYYEWDDRVYERVMRERPGKTIPVRVELSGDAVTATRRPR